MLKILELPSTIIWCEEKYIYNNWIAEFWNSITGISLCIVSIYCFINNYKNTNRKVFDLLKVSNILLFIVGIGTILFHSTLLYIWQLFDEIPMLLIVMEYHKLLSVLHGTDGKIKFYKNIYLLIPVIILSYFVNYKLQIVLFQGILAIYIIYILYLCNYINRKLNIEFYNSLPISNSVVYNYNYSFTYKYNDDKYTKKYEDKNEIILQKKLDIFIQKKNILKISNKISVSILIFSLIIWNIDNHYCNSKINWLELHAVWHITTSIGMYYCNKIMRTYIELYLIKLE
jgi:dihydroceramidase